MSVHLTWRRRLAGTGLGGGRRSTGPAPGATDDPRRSGRRRRRLQPQSLPYLLLAPALVLELLVHIVPMAVGTGMSLLKLTQFYLRNWQHAPWAGLENYRVAGDVSSPIGAALLHSFLVTCAYTLLVVGLSCTLGLAGAVLLQRAFRGRGLLRALFLVPYALPAYASVITWNFMLQRDSGVVNHVLVNQLHLLDHRPFWLIGSNSFISLVVTAVWRSWPFAFLVLTAGLQRIPDELYEAAALDGAGVFTQIRHITLPMLKPVSGVLVLVLSLWTLNDFNTPFVLFGRSASAASDLIALHIYNASFITWNFGLGSAMSVLLLAFLLVATVVYLRVLRLRRSDD